MQKNFTQIPNRLLEEIARSKVFCEKTRIFCVICRKTYGWNKKSDRIALSQFEEMTGMKRPNICRTLKKLEEAGVIIKMDNKIKISIIHSDNENYPNGQHILSKPIPTKENTKETNTTHTLERDFSEEESFDFFWSSFPKKEGKLRAMEEWKKLLLTSATFSQIMRALEIQKKTSQWREESGRYIPKPENWLKDRRWEDEGTDEVDFSKIEIGDLTDDHWETLLDDYVRMKKNDFKFKKKYGKPYLEALHNKIS